jgi:putative DeoR family transcriptional regulator (stage III sporulation protein D)
MKTYIAERASELAHYIVENKVTVRSAAKTFCVSKSTVHKDVTERLAESNPALYDEVKKVLDLNLSERHIRGGIATKNKYKK